MAENIDNSNEQTEAERAAYFAELRLERAASDPLRNSITYNLLESPTNDVRQLSMINRFHLQVPNSRMSTKAFIFMTRPNMNLFKCSTDTLGTYTLSSTGALNEDLARLSTFNYIYNLGRNEYNKDDGANWLGKRIYMSLEYFGTRNSVGFNNNSSNLVGYGKYKMQTPWLSIMTNQATSYSPLDRELDTNDVSETFHGNKVVYGKPTFKHKTANTMTVNFTDRRDLSLYYTLKLWIEYIQAVSMGQASPFRRYMALGILDYATSMYYVVTDETMENVIYWEKLTGVFPLNVPDSLFGLEEGTNDKDLKYNITFAYSMRSVQCEAHLSEINALYGIINDSGRFDINGEGKWAVGKNNSETIVHKPLSTYTEEAKILANSDLGNTRAKTDRYELLQNFYSNANIHLGDPGRYYYMSPSGQFSDFYPNYLPEYGMHGIPYVNGPYITLGGSEFSESVGQLISTKKAYEFNKSQYKLRWI